MLSLEVKEESGLVIHEQHIRQHAIIEFEMWPELTDESEDRSEQSGEREPMQDKPPAEILEVHVFKADFDNIDHQPIETEEMMPQWFNYDDIPYDYMWLDDIYWYPLIFRNKFFRAYFVFQGHEKIISHKIEQVDPAYKFQVRTE